MHITRTHRFLERFGDSLQRLAIMCRIKNTDKLLKDCDERLEWHRAEMKRLKEFRREIRRKAKTHREEFEMSFSVPNEDDKERKEKEEKEEKEEDKENRNSKARKRRKTREGEKSDLYLGQYT